MSESNPTRAAHVAEFQTNFQSVIKNIGKEKGCYLSKMTGSGSTCYGLFINESCSKAALNSLRKKHPKFWFSIAKTI